MTDLLTKDGPHIFAHPLTRAVRSDFSEHPKSGTHCFFVIMKHAEQSRRHMWLQHYRIGQKLSD